MRWWLLCTLALPLPSRTPAAPSAFSALGLCAPATVFRGSVGRPGCAGENGTGAQQERGGGGREWNKEDKCEKRSDAWGTRRGWLRLGSRVIQLQQVSSPHHNSRDEARLRCSRWTSTFTHAHTHTHTHTHTHAVWQPRSVLASLIVAQQYRASLRDRTPAPQATPWLAQFTKAH